MRQFLVGLCLFGAAVFVTSNVVIDEPEDKLGLGIGLGGINLTLNIPNLSLGISLDVLIDLPTILGILNTPVDPSTVSSCSTSDIRGGRVGEAHPRNVKVASSAKWYAMGDGTYFMAVVMDPTLTDAETKVIYAGMYMISSKTCLKFYLYNEADLVGYDYVKIQKSNSGCYSSTLGRAGNGRQIVNLQPTDSQGRTCMIAAIAAHELLHAIGHAHMQNAPGRNNYVTIVWANIPTDTNTRYQFQEVSSSEFSTLGFSYDYGSVMHYGRYDFTANGGETIHALQGDPNAIGQRKEVSTIDAQKVQKQYGCTTV